MARLKKPWVASVEYKHEFYKAAVFPDENNKLDVTIMESVKAARRDVVGLHMYNVPLRKIHKQQVYVRSFSNFWTKTNILITYTLTILQSYRSCLVTLLSTTVFVAYNGTFIEITSKNGKNRF